MAPTAGRVVAVEPDERMRSVLASRSAGVDVLAGRGEALPLPDASADAVVVSSAWHWMDADLAVPEIARVLRDGGRFGVLSTNRERSIPWLRFEEWFAREDAEETTMHAVAARAVPAGARPQVILPDPGAFHNIETQVFRFTRTMAVLDLIDWLTTYSWVITASDEAKAAGRARAAAGLAESFPGATQIEVPMQSRCWRADRVPR